MFKKKRQWGFQTLKALFIAGIMYRFARFFMNMAVKQYKEKKTDYNKDKRKKNPLYPDKQLL